MDITQEQFRTALSVDNEALLVDGRCMQTLQNSMDGVNLIMEYVITLHRLFPIYEKDLMLKVSYIIEPNGDYTEKCNLVKLS